MTGEELRNADAAANSAVVGEGVKFERIRRITGYLVRVNLIPVKIQTNRKRYCKRFFLKLEKM